MEYGESPSTTQRAESTTLGALMTLSVVEKFRLKIKLLFQTSPRLVLNWINYRLFD